MKNRFLPSCFLAFLLGFSLLFLQSNGFAGSPGSGTGALNLKWNPVGPDNMPGRSRAVIFDKRDATGNTVICGSVDGGLWKSTNYGLTWNQINAGAGEVPKVTCLIQDPTSGTIYAGTGESFCITAFTGLKDFSYNSGLIGNGIWMSSDGNTFSQMPGTQPTVLSTAGDWAQVNKLAVDIRNGRVYAATNTGLKYKDGTADWVLAKAGFVFDVKVGDDGTVLTEIDNLCYIAIAGDMNNFVNLSTDTPNLLPSTDVGRVEFAIAPSDNNVLYACIAKKSDGKLLNVYVSQDKGYNWRIIFPGNSSYDPFAKLPATSGFACYDMTIVVVPNDPFQILLGGTEMWWGKKYLETGFYNWEQISFSNTNPLSPSYVPSAHHCYTFYGNDASKLIIATDGGITTGNTTTGFKTTNKNLNTCQMTSVGFTYAKNIVIGGTQGSGTILIDGSLNTPQSAISIANAGGQGYSGGCAEMSVIDPNAVSFTTFVKPTIATPKPTTDLSISEDRGAAVSLKFPGTYANTINFTLQTYLWESFNYVNALDSITYYANEAPVAAGYSVLVYSPNAKFPFYYILPHALSIGDSIRVPNQIQSRFFAFFSRNSKMGLYMTKDFLQYTVDPSWYQIASIDSAVTCITVSKDMNYLFAGTKSGKVYRVSNLALAQTYATADISSPTCIVASEVVKLNPDKPVTSISISPEDNNRVVYTLGNYGNTDYVYMTSNALDSMPNFVSVQGNLPKAPVYSCLIEMNDKNRVILGTDNGIYSSDNVSSATWTADNDGIGNTPVFMLKQQTNYFPPTYIDDKGKIFTYPGVQNYGTIYAASYGNGIFIDTTYFNPMGIDPGKTNTTFSSLHIYPNPFKDRATVSYTLLGSGNVTFTICDISGRMIKTINETGQSKGDHTLTIDLQGQPAGSYIIRMNSPEGISVGKLMKSN